jgi:CRP-like cAMP-binding protein
MSFELRQHIEKIVKLTDEEFKYVLSHFTVKKLKKHQFVIQEGDNVFNSYFVIKGLLKAYFYDSKEKLHILQFAMENWWITDYPAYFQQGQATINIDCLENVELLSLSYENREKLCSELHKMEHYFRKIANSGYIAIQKRVVALLSNNAQERYDQLLQQYPLLFQRVPKSLIASYLGVTRETLSRLKS